MFLLVLAYPGSPGPKAVKRLCVCVTYKMAAKNPGSLLAKIWNEITSLSPYVLESRVWLFVGI